MSNVVAHTETAETAAHQHRVTTARSTCIASVFLLFAVLIPVSVAGATSQPPAGKPSGAIGSLLATLNAPVSKSANEFGTFVAVSGDTAVVGEPPAGSTGGAAFVYRKTRSNWSLGAVLQNPTKESGGSFGGPIAVSGKTIVVVGSAKKSQNAYIFSKGDAGWPVKPTATLPGPAGSSGFGSSVAVSGTTVIVGAEATDQSSGAAYIYTMKDGAWPTTPSTTLVDPAGKSNDVFGSSVAVDPSSIVVGAASDLSVSSAYVYSKTATGWPTTPTVTLPDPASSKEWFGSSVALSGKDIVVGDPDSGNVGAAYIYTMNDNVWPTSPTTTLINPHGIEDLFAASTSISGSTVVVSSFGGASYGAAYVYKADGSVWPTNPTATITDVAAPTNNLFGDTIAVSGNVFAVGSPEARRSSVPAAAYLYRA
jgi:hypothetical protein